MKALILLISLLVSSSVFAAPKSAVYCKVNSKIYNADSEQGQYECLYSLMEGSACFTGRRAEVIELINDRTFGSDEEWIDKAHYQGRDSISYLFIDGPNELQEKVSMDRCDSNFWQN